MARLWTYAFEGIGAGFLAGFVLVGMMPNSEGDGWLPISLLLGSFLAGVFQKQGRGGQKRPDLKRFRIQVVAA